MDQPQREKQDAQKAKGCAQHLEKQIYRKTLKQRLKQRLIPFLFGPDPLKGLTLIFKTAYSYTTH
jgi:hypothetical protein